MAHETDQPGGFGAKLGGLLTGADPLFNFGIGLLASPRGASFGQSLGQAAQFASGMGSQQLRNNALRENIRQQHDLREDAARRREAFRELQEILGGGGGAPGPQLAASAGAPIQLASAFGSGGGGAVPPGAVGESPASRRQQIASLAAIAFPEQFGQGVVGQLFPKPQNPTNLQREFEFLVSQGVSPERAIEALQKGTTVNVGGAEPLSVTDLTKIQQPNGDPFPPGTTLSQAVAAGGVVRTPEQQKQATAAAGSLDMLNELERVVNENNITPGFVSEGGIAEMLATSAGQVVSAGAGLLGQDLTLTPAQGEALSLQENLGNAMLQAMRGASVGPEEQKKFEQQLPRLSQDPAVFKANVKNTRRNLRDLDQRSESQGATSGAAGGVTIGGNTYSQEDLEFTATERGMTVDEVISILQRAANR